MTDGAAEETGLPELTEDGVLPVGVHVATLDEVGRVFVTEAPHSEERALIFGALGLYAMLIWTRFPEAVLWIDGGFVTHKQWAAPGDVDVVVVLPSDDYDLSEHPEDMALWTLMGVSAWQPSLMINAPRLKPMGGLVDGFYVPAGNQAVVDFWRDYWKRLKVPGQPDKLNAKGFVEVRPS